MARVKTFGVFQLRDRKTGRTLPTWYCRRDVPVDVRPVIGKNVLVKTTGKTKRDAAANVAESIWLEWTLEIADARKLGSGPFATQDAVLAALETWREACCSVAAGLVAEVAEAQARKARGRVPEIAARGVAALYGLPTHAPEPEPQGPLHLGAAAWARAYFDKPENALKSSAPGLLASAGMLIGKLQVAARDSTGWRGVPEFDSRLDGAAKDGGLPAEMTVLPKVRDAVRPAFAKAWLEVARHEEAERQRAAAFLTALAASAAQPEAVLAAPQQEFEPREGDVTVGEAIDAFKAARDRPDLEKQYSHIFRCLREVVGADKPMRSLSRGDVRDVHRFLATLPSNASKIYPKLTLAEAAERAEADGRKLIAPNTVRSYLLNLSAVCNFAVDEGFLAANPCSRQIPAKMDTVKRRGFSKDELEKVFAALADERATDSARYWVPAVLAWSGARANEIAQLHCEDVKEVDGVAYLDMGLFDADGVRLERRRLKNAASARAIPIHSDLIKARFLDFVGRRRAAGEERLFPELRANAFGYYTHELSKGFGRLLDNCELSEPSLCLHSFRHGFKDSAEEARLPEYILRGVGGWATKDQMEKYGSRCSPSRVRENSEHIEMVRLGGFSLGVPGELSTPTKRAA